MTPRKSRYLCAAVRSHAYSNCRVRQTLDNCAPRPGKSSSAIAKMGRGSKIGKPSKAIALMADFASVAAAVAVNIPEAVTVLEAISRNLRRLIDLELLRARWVSDIHKHPGYAKREVRAVLRKGFSQVKRQASRHLAVLLENATRSRARSSVLTSETAQKVKPPATQDSML
jgi:hypothetical protein